MRRGGSSPPALIPPGNGSSEAPAQHLRESKQLMSIELETPASNVLPYAASSVAGSRDRDRVLRRFPYLEPRIAACWSESASFRGICHDFVDALEALQHWQVSQEPRARQRATEYRKLVRALEAEILVELYHIRGK